MSRLFGTRGIRGSILTRVTPELALRFGEALASHLGNGGEVTVGRDNRTSSEMLEAAVVSGLVSGGCDGVMLGLVPIPALAFQTREARARGGVMVTASHNPPADNGLKCLDGEGMDYLPQEEEALERLVAAGEGGGVPWDRVGGVTEFPRTKKSYVEAVLRRIPPLERRIRVVVDCANGAASDVTPTVLRRLGCEVVAVNDQPDGHFPGRPPEPTPENLQALGAAVRNTRADLGVAHDGDGDRLAVLDGEGRFLAHSRVIALFAAEALRRLGGGLVVTSVDTSLCIDQVVEGLGGTVERTRLGEVHAGLRGKGRVVMVAEPWKIIDPSWGPWVDGVYSAVRLAKMLDEGGGSVTRLFSGIPSYPEERTSFFCPEEEKARAMERVSRGLARDKAVAGVWTFDGLRVNYEDGSWILLRPSGTEPKIRLYAEARTRRRLRELVMRGRKLVQGVAH